MQQGTVPHSYPEDYRKMADTARKEAEQYSFEEFKKQMLAFVEKHARTA
jgi:hypothetical protein